MTIQGMMCAFCHCIFSLEDKGVLEKDEWVVFNPTIPGICKQCEEDE